MPIFHVNVSQNLSQEFVVNAPNRNDAENFVMAALTADKCDPKKVIHIRTDSSDSCSISDGDAGAWTAALKRKKGK